MTDWRKSSGQKSQILQLPYIKEQVIKIGKHGGYKIIRQELRNMNVKELKKIGIKNMVLLFVAGIFLLICTMPGIFKAENKVESSTVQKWEDGAAALTPVPVPSAEKKLETILSRIEGVGKTEVMIFYSNSETLIPDGILIVAAGAKKAEVIQHISDATEALFGIPKHKIIVLPMRSESGSN